ncbi:hypothetical protein NEOKW01_0349 [Nematocida sp. AWRm80]|nr:hypothetical protein NEOKW01_0349 [Nematocida sp. AWRm80]
MLILDLFKVLVTKDKYRHFSIYLGFFGILSGIVYFVSQVSLENIKCFSDQSIRAGRYTKENIELEAPMITYYRDPDYNIYSSVLLTGTHKNTKLISQLHQNLLGMENRTKGYDIQIPLPSISTILEYFLVVEVDEMDIPTVILQNRGWQVNSDILALFKNKLEFQSESSLGSFVFPSTLFNKIKIGITEDTIDSALDVFWNINNLYSHSLGVYFYWIVGDKAIFMSSIVPLVILLPLFLVIGEFVSGGSFQARIFTSRIFFLLSCILCPISSLVLQFSMTPFEVSLIYCIIVSIHFPIAILLGISKGLMVLFSMIGRPSGKRFYCGSLCPV